MGHRPDHSHRGRDAQTWAGCPARFAESHTTHNVRHVCMLQQFNTYTCTRALQSLAGHTSSVESVTFDRNEEVVASGACSGSIKTFELQTGKGERRKRACMHAASGRGAVAFRLAAGSCCGLPATFAAQKYFLSAWAASTVVFFLLLRTPSTHARTQSRGACRATSPTSAAWSSTPTTTRSSRAAWTPT